MSDTTSADKFDLASLKVEIDGALETLKKDPEALSGLHLLLSDALKDCEQAMAKSEGKE